MVFIEGVHCDYEGCSSERISGKIAWGGFYCDEHWNKIKGFFPEAERHPFFHNCKVCHSTKIPLKQETCYGCQGRSVRYS